MKGKGPPRASLVYRGGEGERKEATLYKEAVLRGSCRGIHTGSGPDFSVFISAGQLRLPHINEKFHIRFRALDGTESTARTYSLSKVERGGGCVAVNRERRGERRK